MNDAGTVVILTPMNLEYEAVRTRLQERHPVRHRGTAFETGRVPGVAWRIALAVTGEGNPDMAVLTERAAALFHPRALFVVGVAGGLNDDIEPGDVVVATWVYGYHGGKEDANSFQARPRAWRSAHELEQAARQVAISGSWHKSVPNQARPAVHFKPIAAGEVVLDSRDTPLASHLKQHYGDAAAIEMESAGAASAAHLNASLPMLAIRGISDKADGRKTDSDAAGLQPVAASHAAAFTLALIAELPAAPREPWAIQPPAGAPPDGAASPAQEVTSPEIAWRPLPQPLPAVWLPELAPSRRARAAILECHLVPSPPSPVPTARQLAYARDELITVGKETQLFGPAENVVRSGCAAAISPAGAGLAVTGSGQRSAWSALPADTLGAILDPADVAGRLAALLDAVLRMAVPDPVEAGLAIGVTTTVLLSEGGVAELPRSSRRGRTSLTPLRVPATSVLPFAGLLTSPREAAEELAARLFLAFRARHAG